MQIIVSLVQMDVITAHPEKNLRKAEHAMVEAVRRHTDIVCFPEMWTTGFNWTYNVLASSDHHQYFGRVAALAKQHALWVTGSMLALDAQGKLANAASLFSPDGYCVGTYHKTHLFSPLHENKHLTPGDSTTIIDAPWGRTGFAICYDIRFPELFRTYALQGASIIFCPSAFPLPRLEHWKVLLRARAIENQIFVVGVNQVGFEQFKNTTLAYCGGSAIIDPWGRTLCESDQTNEGLITASIDMGEVSRVRADMPVMKDRRPDLYKLQ